MQLIIKSPCIPLYPTSFIQIMKQHLLHARGLLRSPRRQFQPRNQKKGQGKLKVPQPQNLIHSAMIHSTVAVQSEIFMRSGGTWESMATAQSGGLLVKIIKGLEKKCHLLGLMTPGRKSLLLGCMFVYKPNCKALVTLL